MIRLPFDAYGIMTGLDVNLLRFDVALLNTGARRNRTQGVTSQIIQMCVLFLWFECIEMKVSNCQLQFYGL